MVNIWGTADNNAAVKVTLHGESAQGKADAEGNWIVRLPRMKAGGPYQLTVTSGKGKVTLKDVYLGEVWIAGGQSNMGSVSVAQSVGGAEAVAQADNNDIRFIYVPKMEDNGMISKGEMTWKIARGDVAADMPSISYYFADKLQRQTGVPVGIVLTPRGASPAESWIPCETLVKNPITKPLVDNYDKYMAEKGEAGAKADYEAYLKADAEYRKNRKTMKQPQIPMGPYNFRRPGGLYETMLQRVIPFTARGVIWYQGEANSGRAWQYRTLFPMVIEQWRTDFQNPDMYFYFVQLANFGVKGSKIPTWAELREAQLLTSQTVKNTDMAVAIDVGDKEDIHPRNKRPVGERLAALALNNVYGYKQPCHGPSYKGMMEKDGKLILTFETGAGKLETNDGKAPSSFEIAGADMKFVPAQARIEGDKVVVWADGVAKPAAVRYGWANWPECNLFNDAGLPASPFRTDDLPLISQGKLF